jgi:transketolase
MSETSYTEPMEASRLQQLRGICKLMRCWILESTHEAGSGHPTSSLSAVELIASLFFGGHFCYDIDQPDSHWNDRLIFSKGHASPLFYAAWAAAGAIDAEKLKTYRQFDSGLEGHPTARFPFTEAATGSLGQGLSLGAGMAMHAKLEELPYRTFVLLGDSEMAEGSQWEAIQLAAHYQLDRLVGLLDVNRLGQRGETMFGRDVEAYRKRIDAFGWKTVVIDDGHDLLQIDQAFRSLEQAEGDERPVMLLANTIKGKGISFLEDENGWHGKSLDDEQLRQGLAELGEVDRSTRGSINVREAARSYHPPARKQAGDLLASDAYALGEEVATRDAYGKALKRLAPGDRRLIALDGEVCNSTRSKTLRDASPEQFLEMFIAEQNMVGMAVGLALRGRLPFVSTFAAFLTRAFDQIRMAVYSNANVKFVGSHCGVSIGQDGPSQMGLEDIAMFRSLDHSIIFYPADAVSTERMVEQLLEYEGIGYLRTTRGKTPVIYRPEEEFPIGGSKTLRTSDHDELTLVAAGVTLHAALTASERLAEQGILARVIDVYSVKPLDVATLRRAARETTILLVVEDHFEAGGIGEAVRSGLWNQPATICSLAVTKRPRSGSSSQLMQQQGIDAESIVQAVLHHLPEQPGARR